MNENIGTRQEVGAIEVGAMVSTQSRVIKRGSLFSVRIQIANNGDRPFKISSYSWTLPPGLEFEALNDPNNENILGQFLRPGDSFALTFSLSAHSQIGALWASIQGKSGRRTAPARVGGYRISINLAFDDEAGRTHWREVPAELSIHPSPIEIYLAAIIASLAGSFIKYANSAEANTGATATEISVAATATALLAFFVAVIGQRRTNIQFGFSIEDWAGGAIVGFLVGYIGSPFVDAVLSGTIPS